jgi:N-acetylmuramoyl-L-alanine amidase
MRIAISSGHGLFVRGARGLIDEVDEARRVTDRVGEILLGAGVGVNVFHENITRTPRDNVNTIVRHHNGQERDLDVSVHFNAFNPTEGFTQKDGWRLVERAVGVEVLYRSGNAKTRTIAGHAARAIANASGLLLRHKWREVAGAVPRGDLGFLNNTSAPAILLEVCFVNSGVDAALYLRYFDEICYAIAGAISGRVILPKPQAAALPMPALPQPSTWASEAWAWGTGLGITDGTNPQGQPTREQMITLLHRYHKAMS